MDDISIYKSSSASHHPRLWTASIAVLVVLATFILLAYLTPLLKTSNTSEYGVLVGKGVLDSWTYKYGRALFTLENDKEVRSDYSIYITDQTKFMKAVFSPGKGDERTLEPGNLNEITEGINLEVYLQNPYSNVTRQTKTIIYWE